MSRSTADTTDSGSRLEAIGGRLSARSRETMTTIERLLGEGLTQDEVAKQLGLPRREVERARAELRTEAEALEHGASLPDLSKEENTALVDSIAELTQLVPILVDEEGGILDGNHRKAACEKLGVDPQVVVVETHGDPEIRRRVALAANTARRSLSPADRRRVIEAELTFDPQRSDRSIAASLGVANHTVARVRHDLEEHGALLRLDGRKGADGVVQRRVASRRPTVRRRTKGDELVLEIGFIDQREVNGIAFGAPGVRLFMRPQDWVTIGSPAKMRMVLRGVS